MCNALSISITFCLHTNWLIHLTYIFSTCVPNVRLSFSWDSIALPRLHNDAPQKQPFNIATVLFSIRSLHIMALCVHVLYSMHMHSCLNTCLRENMCLSCPSGQVCGHVRMHACTWMHLCMCIACLSPPKSPRVSLRARECVCECLLMRVMCVHVCFCVYVHSVAGLQGAAPYLALAAGGVQQVPNCCRPHNGFYKPGAGTGLWPSCRLESPPLYPCRLHWRSSQSMEKKIYRVQFRVWLE